MVASQGLEPQQAESESAVLPLHHEAIACFSRLAGSTGLEPATPGSTVQCANQLRHNPVAPKSNNSISHATDKCKQIFYFFNNPQTAPKDDFTKELLFACSMPYGTICVQTVLSSRDLPYLHLRVKLPLPSR